MGTSNFHSNSDTIYVIDYGADEFMWEEATTHLGELVHVLDSAFTYDEDITSADELRSFPTSSVGYFEFDFCYLNLTFTLRVNIFIRSGYYEAANLDIEYEWLIDWDNHYGNLESVNCIIDEINSDPTTYDIQPGLWSIHSHRLAKHLEQLQSTSLEHVHPILNQVSTPYGVAARFSNGETIYERS